MKIRGTKKQVAGEENIVPMINVVFLLLIFFLLAGTINPSPPFELDPVSTKLQPPGRAPEDGLYVSAVGEMYYSGQQINIESLPDAARSGVKSMSESFEVIVDRRLSGEALFPIMEALSKAGFMKVRLVTERSTGG